jgi:hypothetical protein
MMLPLRMTGASSVIAPSILITKAGISFSTAISVPGTGSKLNASLRFSSNHRCFPLWLFSADSLIVQRSVSENRNCLEICLKSAADWFRFCRFVCAVLGHCACGPEAGKAQIFSVFGLWVDNRTFVLYDFLHQALFVHTAITLHRAQ